MTAGGVSTLFTFDPRSLRDTYEQQGWIHIPGGATLELCEYVRGYLADCRSGGALSGKGIRGAKDQFLLELPDGLEYTTELFDTVATLCGLDRSGMTLSERHVKCYLSDADPSPRAHKDRMASQVALGISVEVPKDSYLCLYPDDGRDVNPMLRAGLIDTLLPEESPEAVLRDAAPVEIHDAPGDVQVFPGSSVWHLRRNGAGTVIVYLKLNDFGADPLGEDPHSGAVRARTLAVMADDELLEAACPRLARRFETVTREHSRDWRERWLVNVWDQPSRQITEGELATLRAADGTRSVAELAAELRTRDEVVAAVCRLAEMGALDLVTPGDR